MDDLGAFQLLASVGLTGRNLREPRTGLQAGKETRKAVSMWTSFPTNRRDRARLEKVCRASRHHHVLITLVIPDAHSSAQDLDPIPCDSLEQVLRASSYITQSIAERRTSVRAMDDSPVRG